MSRMIRIHPEAKLHTDRKDERFLAREARMLAIAQLAVRGEKPKAAPWYRDGFMWFAAAAAFLAVFDLATVALRAF